MEYLNTGPQWHIHGPERVYPVDTEVVILRGRQKGRMGTISYMDEPHPLSIERRFAVYVFSPIGFWDRRLLLLNESAFKVVDNPQR